MQKLLMGLFLKGFGGKTNIYQKEFYANLRWFGHDNNKEALREMEKVGWIEWNRRRGKVYDIRNDMFKNRTTRKEE